MKTRLKKIKLYLLQPDNSGCSNNFFKEKPLKNIEKQTIIPVPGLKIDFENSGKDVNDIRYWEFNSPPWT